MSQKDWGELERAALSERPEVRREQTGLALWWSLRGRISRSTYWLKFALPITIMQWAALALDSALGYQPVRFGPVRAMAGLITFWPGIVAAVKRLHDLGHPGWFLAIFYGGAIGAGIALAIAVPLLGTLGLLLGIPMIFLALGAVWFSIKIMFFRGTIGANEYGPDPVH